MVKNRYLSMLSIIYLKKIKLQIKMKQKIIKKNDDKSNKNNYKYSFILAWILSNINVEINDTNSQLLQFSYGVLIISIVALFCVFSIIGYFIANYLLEKVDFEKKYPKIGKYLNRFKKVGLIYLSIDLLLCLICLIILIFYSLIIISHIQFSL